MSLSKIIKQMAVDSVNSTSPSDLMLGEVLTPLPDITIRFKDNEKMVLTKEFLVINQALLNYKRTVNLTMHSDPTKETIITIESAEVTEQMSTQGYSPHTHDITNLKLDKAVLTATDVEIEFTDELKEGDIVMLESFSGGQMFYVSSRVVTFE